MRPDRRWRLAIALAALAVLARPALAGPYDPRLEFRTITTPHFVIHFHQGEEALARRLAVEAERIGAEMRRALGRDLPGRTHVVLADQSDLSNGTASVLPLNVVRLDAVPPPGESLLGNTGDWLTYVFTHEYAHVLHLDRSRGWARVARAALGRTPFVFPNLSLPLWQVEGFATFVESRAGGGRLHAGDFRAIVTEAARAGRFEPLDRVGGGLVDWPGPQGWYAYGARFHEYLARTYGADSIARLADRSAGRVPFFTAGAFRAEYGASLGELWRDFARFERTPEVSTLTSGERLTRLGFTVDSPRLDSDGRVLFTAASPHGYPAVYRLRPGGRPERLLERQGGHGLVVRADWLLFDQLEIVRNTALVSDLFLYDRRSAVIRRLTREARLMEPDLAPDDVRLAAVRAIAGGRQLVVLDARRLLRAQEPVGASDLPVLREFGGPGDVFADPRWSPDGRLLAVEHRAPNGPSRILLIDPEGGEPRIVTSTAARNVTPAWTPGGRLLFASDRGAGAFQSYAWDGIAAGGSDGGSPTLSRMTDAPGGCRWPLPLGDGRLVAVCYGPDGDDLWGLPADVPAVPVARAASHAAPSAPALPAGTSDAPASEYEPWSTLAPRGWVPLVDVRDDRWWLGGIVTGTDVLQRHVVSASATWGVFGADAHGALAPRARPDWSASYVYQRWQPALVVAVRDRTSLYDATVPSGALVPVAEREQQVDAGVVLPFARVRRAHAVRALVHRERVTLAFAGGERRQTRAGLRLGWTLTTARAHGYSISPERGVSLGVTGEVFRPAFGADAPGEAWSADVRAYLPAGWPHAVLAIRAAGAASAGDAGARRLYRLGGASGDGVPGAFGSDAISLLRGFPGSRFTGTRVALANVEARLPLWRPQRGVGTWPLFLRTVHASAFLDAGHAWTGRARWRDAKIGVGAELGADVTAGFGLPLTWSIGVGWGRDGAGTVPDSRQVYVRVGRSF